MNYYKKYLKYKLKYINLKQNIKIGGTTEECNTLINLLKNKIKELANQNDISDENLDNDINELFEKDITNENNLLKKLFNYSYLPYLKPLWWSGFDLSDIETFNKFKSYTTILNKYTNVNTFMEIITNSSNYYNFERICTTNNRYINFVNNVSKLFTLNGLHILNSSSTDYIDVNLLVNKDVDGDNNLIQESYFYKIELCIIIDFCIKHKKNLKLHIHNLKSNCEDMINIIEQYLKELIISKKTDDFNLKFEILCETITIP